MSFSIFIFHHLMFLFQTKTKFFIEDFSKKMSTTIDHVNEVENTHAGFIAVHVGRWNEDEITVEISAYFSPP